jgi:prolyl oligopeptidase
MPLTTPVEETVHGVTISDPYRWLEDRSLPETEAWIGEQQRRTRAYFAASPELAMLERRVRAYLDVEVVDQPARVLDRYFYRKRREGEEQGSLYTREVGSGRECMLIDPSSEGRYTSVGIYRISRDGSRLAYEVKQGGEDRKRICFIDVRTQVVLPESLPLGYARGLVFSTYGYFYSQETEGDTGEHTIRFHAFGSQRPDRVVLSALRTRGSRLVLTGSTERLGASWLRPQGSQVVRDLWVADIEETPSWSKVFREKPLSYAPVLARNLILALDQTDAKNSRLIELSIDGRELREIVPGKGIQIQQVAVTRDRVFVRYEENGVTRIDAWLVDGQRGESINLPVGGTIDLMPGYGQDTRSLFYSFESFDVPPTIYEHFAGMNNAVRWHQRGPRDPARRYLVREESVPTKDGTRVPLTLVSIVRKEAVTPAPAIMTSYGGFGITMTPQFSVLVTIMMELGAVFAMPQIRGGGEFGSAWHDAGRGRNRQASFDDFIASAEWLCQHRVTTPDRLAIFGGSNSGLLVGAAMTERPDLFGAVLCIAPLLDMLRYESFDHAVNWRREYGTVENPEDFKALYAYSPYHHVAEDVNYPATMFVTGDKDDRCNPAHVRKMAARLQGRSAQRSEVIVDYSVERGHSPLLPLSVRIDALARRIAFLCRELHIALPNGVFDDISCA